MNLVLDDLSIVVRENFNLTEFEQDELLAKIKRFYFGNDKPTRDHLGLCRAVDVSIGTATEHLQ